MSSSSKPAFHLGTLFTIIMFIASIFIIIYSIGNCIVYSKISSGEPNNDISVGFARFLLAMSIIGAIFGFVIFFWIIFIWFKGKEGKKNFGASLEALGGGFSSFKKSYVE
jgi:hypothetical protein